MVINANLLTTNPEQYRDKFSRMNANKRRYLTTKRDEKGKDKLRSRLRSRVVRHGIREISELATRTFLGFFFSVYGFWVIIET